MRAISSRYGLLALCFGFGTSVHLFSAVAGAVSSSELYTTTAYPYGRFEARTRFAFGDGIISSFFLWKDGSEMSDVFWNELDFEKLRANCELETNAIYGLPEASHNAVFAPPPELSPIDLCGAFHTYTYEWTPDYIAWQIDGVEIRRETGATATAFRDNASQGMQLHFNVWPGNAEFGGNFSPNTLPVHQYINWVRYSSYANGSFTATWQEDFNSNSLPSGWSTGTWDSPKGLSTHKTANVTFKEGYAVLSLTADDATGFNGAVPSDTDEGTNTDTSTEALGASTSGGASTLASDDATGLDSSSESVAPTTTVTTSTTSITEDNLPQTATSEASDAPTPPQTSDTSTTAPTASSTTTPAIPSSTTTTTASSDSPTTSPTGITTPTDSPTTSSGGCNCHVARSNQATPWAWLPALLALAAIRIRRPTSGTRQRCHQ